MHPAHEELFKDKNSMSTYKHDEKNFNFLVLLFKKKHFQQDFA